MPQLRTQVPTPDGWRLGVRRLQADGPPVLMVPGFGMNSSILAHHPDQVSFMATLQRAGFDTWAADLRGQGDNRGDPSSIGLAELATVDLPTVLNHIRDVTGAERVHMVGCSLGGVLGYTLLSRDPNAPIGKLVAVGSPFLWGRTPPIVRGFAATVPITGRWAMRGNRQWARFGLPIAARLVPGLLSIYLNPEHVDTSQAAMLAGTIDDTSPRLNRQIGAWIRDGVLRIEGTEIGPQLAAVDRPLLLISGSSDGIAPARVVESVAPLWGGPVATRHVGNRFWRWAHTDLFLARRAPQEVFQPVADFLAA